jgi:hypothetical protein
LDISSTIEIDRFKEFDMIFILPLIPLAIGLIGGGIGILADLDARANEKQAFEIGQEAQSHYDCTCKAINKLHEETQDLAAHYGEIKLAVQEDTIGRFLDLTERIDRANSYQQQSFSESFDGAKPSQVREYQSIRQDAIGIINGRIVADTIAGTAVDRLVEQGLYALVGMVGTASTGTAISGLSGIAAHNATLAWFGGGSLAAGGGGMALGGMVLGGITLVPSLILSGFRLAKGDKALTDALEYQSEVNAAIDQMVIEEEFQLKLQKQIFKLGYLLQELNNNANTILDRFESTPFEQNRDTDRFKRLALLIKALAEIANTPIIGSDCKLNPATKILIIKYSDL